VYFIDGPPLLCAWLSSDGFYQPRCSRPLKEDGDHELVESSVRKTLGNGPPGKIDY